ncbi:MAG: transcriptional regulator [Betaproteobacteria bacterium]|nr:transcriptional regulator [Betaproteobacteria bacterium]
MDLIRRFERDDTAPERRHRSTVKRRVGCPLRAVQSILEDDVDTGKAVLRDYINATVGFEELGKATGTPPKSLMRMFGPRGNPQAKNLFAVIDRLQRTSGISIDVRVGH